MAAVEMFIDKFRKKVLIDENHPLAVEQRAKDALESAGAASSVGQGAPFDETFPVSGHVVLGNDGDEEGSAKSKETTADTIIEATEPAEASPTVPLEDNSPLIPAAPVAPSPRALKIEDPKPRRRGRGK